MESRKDTGERRRSEDARFDEILKYISEGNSQRAVINDTLQRIELRCTNVELMIHGDSKAIDRYTRDGINRRLETVEQKEKDDKEAKKNFINIAVGSVTLAIGGAMVWVFNVLRDAFIHKP